MPVNPFGWAAPSNIDPLAWKFIGQSTPDQPKSIVDAGAFSINLWEREVLNFLPHNGGDSY
jgi:hypothetical protein